MMIPFNVLGSIQLRFFDAAVSLIRWQEACFLGWRPQKLSVGQPRLTNVRVGWVRNLVCEA